MHMTSAARISGSSHVPNMRYLTAYILFYGFNFMIWPNLVFFFEGKVQLFGVKVKNEVDLEEQIKGKQKRCYY